MKLISKLTPIAHVALIKAVMVGIMGMTLVLTGCEKWRLDAQVKELCAKDGGIKVYETVKLPAAKFDKFSQVNFYRPTQGENALGPEYVLKTETHYYRSGNPEMWRDKYQIFQRSDGRLLGEAVNYSRRGGDLPGPWH